MILFDYIVYIWSNIYKRSKWERETDSFYISGFVAGGATFSFFLIFILIFIDAIFKLGVNIFVAGTTLMFTSIAFFTIRYLKYISQNEINNKITTLSKLSIFLLNTFLGFYFIVILAGLIFIIFFNPYVKA